MIRAVTLQEYKEEQAPKKITVLDYLRSGWQINLGVAIDYTASNGDQTDPDSLHFMGPNNQYEYSITMVGGLLEAYDYDKIYPVFGFGAKPNFMDANATVSHCFPLTGNPQTPYVQGVQGIIGIYRQTLP